MNFTNGEIENACNSIEEKLNEVRSLIDKTLKEATQEHERAEEKCGEFNRKFDELFDANSIKALEKVDKEWDKEYEKERYYADIICYLKRLKDRI